MQALCRQQRGLKEISGGAKALFRLTLFTSKLLINPLLLVSKKTICNVIHLSICLSWPSPVSATITDNRLGQLFSRCECLGGIMNKHSCKTNWRDLQYKTFKRSHRGASN